MTESRKALIQFAVIVLGFLLTVGVANSVEALYDFAAWSRIELMLLATATLAACWVVAAVSVTTAVALYRRRRLHRPLDRQT